MLQRHFPRGNFRMRLPTLSRIIVASFLTALVECCAKTVPASQPATTTPQPCAECSSSTPTLDPAGQVGNEIRSTPIASTATTNSDGCLQKTIECEAVNNFAFMIFNGDIGGPCPDTPGASCFATLVCNSDEQWTFTSGGVTTVITEVTCLSL